MNLFAEKSRNRVLSLLIGGWLLAIVLAIISHWKVFRFLGVGLLIAAILFFMISILYAMIGDKNPTSKTKHK